MKKRQEKSSPTGCRTPPAVVRPVAVKIVEMLQTIIGDEGR